MNAAEPGTTSYELERLTGLINRAAVSSLTETAYYCNPVTWPRCKPSLDRMIGIRDKIQMAMAEVKLCL